MLSYIFEPMILVHVVAGIVGLAAFWVPVIAPKGGSTHVRGGRVYTYSAYVVTVSALVAALIRIASYASQGMSLAEYPDVYGMSAFLGYLGVVTFANVRQGTRVLATRKAADLIATPFHIGVAWMCLLCSAIVIVLALAAWSDASVILLSLSPVGIFTGSNMLRYMRSSGSRRPGWLHTHFGAMIGSGIAFHTAFAVFGIQSLIAYQSSGFMAILPWILPTLVGVPAIVLCRLYYRSKPSES